MVETLYWVGCMATYRLPEVAKATDKILDTAGIDYTTLGNEEDCCGSVLLRIGMKQEAKMLARKNIEKIESMGVMRVVTSCAGCYKTFKKDYPNILDKPIPFEVVHMVELISDLINDGKIEIKKSLTEKVTYHDPCHLGRHCGIYEQPRGVIRRIPGLDLVEMRNNKRLANCCGAGGGIRSAFKDLSQMLSRRRIQEANDTGAKILLSACPFCEYQFKEAVDCADSEINVMDIQELIAGLI